MRASCGHFYRQTGPLRFGGVSRVILSQAPQCRWDSQTKAFEDQ